MAESQELTVTDVDVPRGGALTTLRDIRPGTAVAAFVPQDFEQAVRIARAIAKSNMAPKSYGNDENKILVGMMTGAEVGLTPMQSLRGVAVIGNMPKLWGDVALGLVLASGVVEDMVETTEGSFDDPNNSDGYAVCTIKRKGRPTPIMRRFSVQDARRAGLLIKDTYKGYLERMCQRRARDRAMSDACADVLSGLYIATLEEELEAEQRDERPVPRETVVATVDDLETQARGAEEKPAIPLTTEGAVRATDEHERRTEEAQSASEDLIAKEAARVAAAETKPRVRRSKKTESTGDKEAPEGGPGPDVEAATESDEGNGASGLEAQNASPDATASPRGEEAEFKEVATPEVIKMRRDYIDIRHELGEDKKKARAAGDNNEIARIVQQMTNYTRAIKELEAKYDFPADAPGDTAEDAEFTPVGEAVSDAGVSIYGDDGNSYDLNAGEPEPTRTTLDEAVAELKTKELVTDAAAFRPEGLSEDDVLEFESIRGKYVAGLVEEAKQRRNQRR